MRSEDAATIKK